MEAEQGKISSWGDRCPCCDWRWEDHREGKSRSFREGADVVYEAQGATVSLADCSIIIDDDMRVVAGTVPYVPPVGAGQQPRA